MNNESEDKAEHRTIDACLWNVLIKVCLQLMACINTEDNDKLQLIVTAVASPSSIWRTVNCVRICDVKLNIAHLPPAAVAP